LKLNAHGGFDMDRMDLPVQVYKVPFIGDAGVGKTSLITRYTTHRFLDSPVPTVGVANQQLKLSHLTDSFEVNVWDTAGQERFRSLVPLYTHGSDLIVLAFSLASQETFLGLDMWYSRLRNEMEATCPIIICGCKKDLVWKVEFVEAKNWANNNNCPLIMCSAESGDNVAELFALIAEQLALKRRGGPSQSERVTLPPSQKKGACC
jgi:small GTP-binding protein